MKRVSYLILITLLSLSYSNTASAADIEGTIKVKGVKSPEEVVVYIEKAEGEFKPPEKRPKIDQVNLVFIPRVLPVLVGTTVEFHNSDTVLHNVFGVGDDEFDLGTWKGDKIETHTFNKLGEVAILCNVHPEMEAYVIVLQSPYFALTNEEGEYEIEDVPPGNYRLKTWHDVLKSQTQETVVERDNLTVDFTLKR